MSLCQQVQWSVTFSLMSCGECGMPFYVPENFYIEKIRDKSGWKCPNGHTRVFVGKSVETQLKETKDELARERERLEAATARAHQAWVTKQQQLGKHRALKKRVAAGVCPCCHRTFQQLEAHMKCKHPEYAK